jgi:glutamate-1-semialdehyde 2,1-aminomutase
MSLTAPLQSRPDFDAAAAQALEAASHAYALRNPKSSALYRAAHSYMPGGNTRTALHWSPFPLYVERSTDCRVFDVDGHAYIDVLGEYTAGLYGHKDDTIRSAVQDVLDHGAANGAPGEAEIELAQLITTRFPSVERVRFCNSGTEATLYALSLARLFTKREVLVGFNGAYHGGVFLLAQGGHPINAPYDWRLSPYNDATAARSLIASIGSELAAVIVEPVMSNGGCIPGDAAFLAELRDACDEVGALLIFDEIVTSRMGPGGMQGRLGLRPDLTTFGKYIGGGFSFGAFGGRADILELMNPARPDAIPHAGTFNNNLYSMSAGRAALKQVYTSARAEELWRDGEALRVRLTSAASKVSKLVQFTGAGSIMNIHFFADEISRPEQLAAAPKSLRRLFHLDLLEQGVYAAARGQINLSLPMGDAEFDAIEHAVTQALERRRDLYQLYQAER